MKPYFYDPRPVVEAEVCVCAVNQAHWEQRTGGGDICEEGVRWGFLWAHKQIKTQAHTKACTYTQRKMKPLTINFTAFVEIYSLERNHDHRRSVTKDTVLRKSPHSLAHEHKYTNAADWISKETQALFKFGTCFCVAEKKHRLTDSASF